MQGWREINRQNTKIFRTVKILYGIQWWICLIMYSSKPMERTMPKVLIESISCVQHFCDPMDFPWDFPGKNTWVGCHFLLQRTFPTQGSNPSLLHCKWILYQLSHKGTPRILEWVAYPFTRGSSQSRNQTGVSCIAGGFFTNWATREAQGEGEDHSIQEPRWIRTFKGCLLTLL